MTHLSPLASAARNESNNHFRRHRRRTALRLVLVTLGAIFGALALTLTVSTQRFDPFGIAGLIAFLGVLAVRLTSSNDPQVAERAARGEAISEIVESHSWRYAIGAAPYSSDSIGAAKALDLYLHNMSPYRQLLIEYGWASTSVRLTSKRMTDLRTSSFADRRAAYATDRIDRISREQSALSARYETRWRRLNAVTLVIEIIGIPAGILKAIAFSGIDLLGITAAAAASLSVWTDTLNLRPRARRAAAICAALNSAGDRLEHTQAEHEWSVLVSVTEQKMTLSAEALLAADSLSDLFSDPVDAGEMGPDAYFAAASELKRKIWEENTPLSKLEPDVIIGLNPGGSILGGILYFMTTRASDFLPLSLRSGLSTTELRAILDNVRWNPRKPNRLSILIVDASMKSGESLREAISLVEGSLEDAGWVKRKDQDHEGPAGQRHYTIRTAAIAKQRIANENDRQVVLDYYVTDTAERFPYGAI